MDEERKGRMKAKQHLNPSKTFIGNFLCVLKISYETTLTGGHRKDFFCLEKHLRNSFPNHSWKDSC